MDEDFKVALKGLMAEEKYLREMAIAKSSLSTAIAGMPAQVPNWGPWSSMQSHVEGAFNDFNETVSTANGGLNAVADLIHSTAMTYAATEAALTVGGN